MTHASSELSPPRGDRDGILDVLLGPMPPAVRDSFTAEQREALAHSARRAGWDSHPVDLRLSIPLLVHRYYLALVAGRERRSKARRVAERSRHRVFTLRNAIFLGAMLGAAAYLGSFFWWSLMLYLHY